MRLDDFFRREMTADFQNVFFCVKNKQVVSDFTNFQRTKQKEHKIKQKQKSKTQQEKKISLVFDIVQELIITSKNRLFKQKEY